MRTDETELPPHLQRLNPDQYRAVTSVDGPLLILAGAGSGKTRVLTRRVAHLLHLGVPPDHVLAVTFTNKAAAEMKERVIELVGEAGRRVWVSTFHSTCCRILRQDIEALGYTRRFAIYDDEDQLRLIKDLRASAGYDRERVDPRAIRASIDHYKSRMMTVDEVVDQKRDHPNSALVQTWRAYEEALQAADALDFNDLIGVAVRLFREHPAILSRWRERFRYVMVDEYQDTNRGQYALLRLLTAEHRNLAVVGDDDQSIYGFRGADVSIILSFERDNPDATVVKLEQNYRSTGNILEVANQVAARNVGRLEKKLWTQAPAGPRVELMVAEDARDEARRIARRILQLRRSGHGAGDIAVIYRTNAMSRPLEGAMARAGIPHRVVGGRKFYERREIRDVLGYLRLLVNQADDAALLRVVNVPRRGVGARTLAQLREEAADRGAPLLATIRSGSTARSHAGLTAFSELIGELADLARDLPPAELVEAVVDRSGYREMLASDTDSNGQVTREARGRLDNLEELVHHARAFDAPEGAWTPMDHLTAWLDAIKLATDQDEVPDGGVVTLMTVHSSKGLEYPVVFVAQMNEGSFPHARSEDVGVDEERRLAYVAFTRAKQRLIVSRTRHASDWGGGRGRRQRPAQPSRFLFGLPPQAISGDPPSGDPAEDLRDKRRLGTPGEQKLAALLSHLRDRSAPSEECVLADIESLDEIAPGVRLHLGRHGVCEVRARKGSRVHVRLPDARMAWVDLRSVAAQRVVER